MDSYYAVERSPDFLAHYGIKGMRWGVRKAIERGNSKALGRQYTKAQKKLAKLNAKADIGKQQSIAKKYGKIAAISGSIGAGAAGIHVGSIRLQKKNWNKFDNRIDNYYNKYINPRSDGAKWALNDKTRERIVNEYKEAKAIHNQHLNTHNKLNYAKIASGAIGAAGLAVGAGAGIKALAAKRRTTTGGHAAAVAKRNEFQREMNNAFKGTKYANGAPRQGKKRRR